MATTDPSKTVFISYRRSASKYIARAIFEDLRHHGYDVFLDIETIDSGNFQSIILNQIAARAHFIIILSQGTLERTLEPGDWLRREIEEAIRLKRNIIPIVIDDFGFKENEKFLTGALSALAQYNALNLHYDYFDAGMETLRVRFLKKSTEVKLIPSPRDAQAIVEKQIENVASQPPPTASELTAEEYLVRGLYKATEKGDFKGAADDLSKALLLNPSYATQLDFFKKDNSKKKHVFISYSHDNTQIMKRVEATLLDEGQQV